MATLGGSVPCAQCDRCHFCCGEGGARPASRTLQARRSFANQDRAPQLQLGKDKEKTREEPERAGGATRRDCAEGVTLDLLVAGVDHKRMNKKIIVVLLGARHHSAAQAATAPPAFSPERFRAHVEFLADDLLEGRDTGTRGHEIAARYVASQFESFGLKPGGDEGSWYQQVTLQRTTRGADRGWLEISGPAGEQRFAHADNVLVWLNSREAAFDAEAPLVFVGFGVEDKRLGVDDYRGLNVKGRIVVLLRGFPKGLPSEEGAHLTRGEGQGGREARRHRPADCLDAAVAESRFRGSGCWSMPMIPNSPGSALTARHTRRRPAFVPAPRSTIRRPRLLFAGSARTLADIRLEADKEKGMPRGFALKTRVRMQSTSSWTRVTSPNVIGILPGADPSLAP